MVLSGDNRDTLEDKSCPMPSWLFRIVTLTAVAALLCLEALGSHKKNQEPKPQVLPLPKQLPMALAVRHGFTLLSRYALAAHWKAELTD